MADTQRSGRCARKGVEVRLLFGAPMKLWIDDERPAPEGWIHARNGEEAREWLESNEVITHVSFDHDLGEGQLDGHELVSILEERVYLGLMEVPIMTVHSANPVGAGRIFAAIQAILNREK